jgi:hypothetical protein
MRLQHGGLRNIPRFAAGGNIRSVLFGFRKNREFAVRIRDLACKNI